MNKNVESLDKLKESTDLQLTKLNNELYKKYLNGTITNSFTAINKKTPHTYEENGQQLLFTPEELGIETVELDEVEEDFNLSITSSKLLDIIQLSLTEILPLNATDEELSKYLELNLDVSKYMELTGKKDKNQAVKQIKEDLETLFKARAKATIMRKVKRGRTYKKEPIKMDIRFIDAKPAEAIRQTAPIRLALSYVKYLSQCSQFMYYPTPILIACRNNNVYYIGKKLATHYNMNRTKANKDSISVDKLLKWTPDIPSLDEEKKRGRHYRAYCIDPLEKSLDELKRIGVLKEWYFTNKNKESLSDEQLTQFYTSYDEWKHLYLHFVLKDYPTYQKAIAHNDTKEAL